MPKVRQQGSTGPLAPLPWGQGSLGTGPVLKAAKWGWPIVLDLQLQIQINQRKIAEQGQQRAVPGRMGTPGLALHPLHLEGNSCLLPCLFVTCCLPPGSHFPLLSPPQAWGQELSPGIGRDKGRRLCFPGSRPCSLIP